jgi:type I restriction enzyme M protein
MSNARQQIVNKAWNFAHVLRDDGLSYMAYTEQITFLLFLDMAHEQTLPPCNRPPLVPAKLGWPSLLVKDGDELEVHYRHVLEELGKNAACWLAQEISDDLEDGLAQLRNVASELR